MAFQSFASFGTLRDEITPRAARGQREMLRLSAELEGADNLAAAPTRRLTLPEWAASERHGSSLRRRVNREDHLRALPRLNVRKQNGQCSQEPVLLLYALGLANRLLTRHHYS